MGRILVVYSLFLVPPHTASMELSRPFGAKPRVFCSLRGKLGLVVVFTAAEFTLYILVLRFFEDYFSGYLSTLLGTSL
jgi:hypothetical protein